MPSHKQRKIADETLRVRRFLAASRNLAPLICPVHHLFNANETLGLRAGVCALCVLAVVVKQHGGHTPEFGLRASSLHG